MTAPPASNPAFGQADLSNCEREQIHLAGSIQPHGALLVLREPELVVLQASANAADFLQLDGPAIGQALDRFAGDIAERIRAQLAEPLHALPVAVRCHVGQSAVPVDCLVHRPPDGGLVIEVERAGPKSDLVTDAERALQTILSTSSLASLCNETAIIFKQVTGYDRVMVYRFDEDGHGEVFAEQREPHLEAFLGNRYPASDIPQIARRLYERNRVRVLVDVASAQIGLVPRLLPLTGRDLDMSLCSLRSMSPIHIQYLKNMGVVATLVASLVVGGRLWGLVACHHYVPRRVQYEIRAMCEVLAETIATRIAALESFSQAQAELSVRRLEQRLIEAVARDGDWRGALFDNSATLLQPVGASGAALLIEGQILTAGEVPGTRELRDIGKWLDGQPRAPLFRTLSLSGEDPAFEPLTPVASGVLAVPVSASPGEYLIWFRPERVQTIVWGGDPFKPVVIGNDPTDLSPRRSFSQWHQLMERHCEPWAAPDLTAARLIGETLADVILQFRSVRMLIAQDQLEQVRRQVGLSNLPVIVADAVGRVLLGNQAFQDILHSGNAAVQWLDDLPPFFTEPAEMRARLREVLSLHLTWRGEFHLETKRGESRPFLVRFDPVFSAPGSVIGFVVLFTDLTAQKAALAARRRFQEEIIKGHQMVASRLASASHPAYKNLFSPIIENAQLAALEISDRVDIALMPEMLESVRTSVDRSAEVLEHLIRHAHRIAGED